MRHVVVACATAGLFALICAPTAAAAGPSCTAAAGTPSHVCSTTSSTSASAKDGYVGKVYSYNTTPTPPLGAPAQMLVYSASLNPPGVGSASWSIAACPSGLSSVTIDWGDGATSQPDPAAALANGAIPISGTHVYTQAGNFPVTVATSDAACRVGGPLNVTSGQIAVGMTVVATFDNLNQNVDLHEARIKSCGSMDVTANAISAQAAATFSGPVATFTRELSDPVCPIPAVPYTATIDWGDGQTSPGTVSEDGGTFTVTGTHTYPAAGSFPVTVSARSDDGTSDSGQATASVAAAPAANPPAGGSGVAGATGATCKKKKKPKKKSAAAAKGCKKKKKKK